MQEKHVAGRRFHAPLALLFCLGPCLVLPTTANAQLRDGLRVGFAAARNAHTDAPQSCDMSRAASATIGAISGAVNGAAFGYLVWGASGGVLSSDRQQARTSSRRFMQRGAIIGAGVGALWLAIHPLHRLRCHPDVTFSASSAGDALDRALSRPLAVPTT